MTKKAEDDIVKRLMTRAQWHKQMDAHLDNGPKAWIADRCLEDSGAMEKAAYEIDRLRAREAELVEALRPFAEVGKVIEGPFGPAIFSDDEDAFKSGCVWTEDGEIKTLTWGMFRRARALTAQQEGDGDA